MAILTAYMANAEALLFDLGGVLINIDFDRALAHWAACAGCDPGLLKARFSRDGAFRDFEAGAISDDEYFKEVATALDINIPIEDFRAGWIAILLDARPGMEAVLSELARMRPLYLFSNSNRLHASVWTRTHDAMLANFTDLFVSCEMGLCKPDPDSFGYVIRMIGKPANQILFFDDTEANVLAARTSGLRSVQVTRDLDLVRLLRRIAAEFAHRRVG
jgi:glucose-1-phosphatase